MMFIAPAVLWFTRREYRMIVILYLEHRNARLAAAWGVET